MSLCVVAALAAVAVSGCNETVGVPDNWYGGQDFVSRCARLGEAPKISASQLFDVRLVEIGPSVVDVVISDRRGTDVYRDDRRYDVNDVDAAWLLTDKDQLWIVARVGATAPGHRYSVERASDGSWSKSAHPAGPNGGDCG